MPAWLKRLFNTGKSRANNEKDEGEAEMAAEIGPKAMRHLMGFSDSVELHKKKSAVPVGQKPKIIEAASIMWDRKLISARDGKPTKTNKTDDIKTSSKPQATKVQPTPKVTALKFMVRKIRHVSNASEDISLQEIGAIGESRRPSTKSPAGPSAAACVSKVAHLAKQLDRSLKGALSDVQQVQADLNALLSK